MDYALKERIGKPELFTGRKEELAYFLKWITDIKDEKSQSTAMMARRKMGKTALMERLFDFALPLASLSGGRRGRKRQETDKRKGQVSSLQGVWVQSAVSR